MIVPYIILTSVVYLLTLRYFYSLIKNFIAAKSIGVPIVISPIDPHSLIWGLLNSRLLPYLHHLPEPLIEWTHYLFLGWQFVDDGAAHRKHGPIFTLVTPGQNELIVSDAVAIHDALTRYRVFVKPFFYKIQEILGKNVGTVNGEEWTRHRRITAPAFNEHVSSRVWIEAGRQAEAMLDNALTASTSSDSDFKHISGVQTSLFKDTKTIALHVLMSAGVGLSQDFNGGAQQPWPDHKLSFGDALIFTLENALLNFVLSGAGEVVQWPVFPATLRRTSLAIDELRRYLDEMITQQHPSEETGDDKPKKGNLLDSLMRASATDGDGKTPKLSKEDVRGNLYVFNFAGHETTANALCYAISLLAIDPQWQDWLREEIQRVSFEHDLSEYEKVFPKLKRCQAILYEALRLYPAITWIPRETLEQTTMPTSSGTTLSVPPKTMIHLHLYNLHIQPSIWGSDVKAFRPSRFIISSGQAVPAGWEGRGSDTSYGERLVAPPLGTFTPWSAGPRVCPGMKFAQVEFVGAMVTLYKRAQVQAVGADEEEVGSEEAKGRLRGLVLDSGFRGGTLQMRKPEEVRLKWTKIEG